ncbi:MAG: zinc ABC transporter substrate-binding protein [Thermoplasmata archaeon]
MNTKQKMFLGVVAIILIASMAAGVFLTLNENKAGKLNVVATFYPLYFFASEIGKEKAEVSMLIPDNAEVHSWEPGVSDMLKMEKARVFIYNGAGLEPWVEKFLDEVETKPVIVDSSQNIQLQITPHLQEKLEIAAGLLSQNCTPIPPASQLEPNGTTAYCLFLNNTSLAIHLNISQEEKILFGFNHTVTLSFNAIQISPGFVLGKEKLGAYSPLALIQIYQLEAGTYEIVLSSSSETLGMVVLPIEGEAEEEHEHGIYDPHIWLDPVLAKIQVRNILNGFISADPQNADFYKQNAELLLKKLDKLHSDFVSGLKNKTKNDIICAHLAFNYMGKRYGFNVHAALGITADKEPSPEELAQLVDKIREYELHYVFVEPGYPDSYMQTVARETGAGVLVLDAIHGRRGDHAGMDYFQIMYENLKNLRIGLEVVE